MVGDGFGVIQAFVLYRRRYPAVKRMRTTFKMFVQTIGDNMRPGQLLKRNSSTHHVHHM